MCYRYANDENKTSEIVNDAFLIIFKNIQKYEGKGSFEGWIRRITSVSYTHLDVYKRQL